MVPIVAATWAIPWPMVPAPMTAIVRTWSRVGSVTGGRYVKRARLTLYAGAVTAGTHAALAFGLAVVAGCNFEHGSANVAMKGDAGDGVDVDAPLADARPDSPPGESCFGTGLLVQCYPPAGIPTGDYHPTAGTIDTGNAASCDRVIPQSGGNPELCLKQVNRVIIDASVRYRGTRPMVLLAVDSIEVTLTGTLDVSTIDTALGAGANTGSCASAAKGTNDPSNSANAGAGGGGGGGFGTGGGAGGAGDVGGGTGAQGTALTAIRGGCAGAVGGDGTGNNGGTGGAAGAGGGGIYLIAGNQITIAGTVKANGGRGHRGQAKSGGGGGGSGGFVGLDAPNITVSGTVFANGAGGGESAGGGDGGEPTQWDQRAPGGQGLLDGGNGGDGSVAANGGQSGASANNGGGGGGGGGGRIKVYPPRALTGRISPPPT